MAGWDELGRVLAGGVNTTAAYQQGATRAAQLEGLIAQARIKKSEADTRANLPGALTKLDAPADLATLFAAGIDPRQLSGYTGDVQEQGFRGDAASRALAGDWSGANAALMGVANGPQQLAKIEGQNLLGNVFLEGGGGISTTEQGRSSMAADAARARASDASAANSYASASRTRQATGIDAAEFGMKRAGQWNPGGASSAAGAGQKPLPVGALKELLGVEEALGSTQVMSDIIQKHTGRLNDGSLQISPLNAALAWGRTKVGQATGGDVAINEWEADKTKLVNESLRLNKGVQTEGDAQRAVAELMGANDGATASRALRRLAELNARAVELQQRKAGLINENYGRAAGPSSAADAFSGALPAAAPVQRATNPTTGQVLELRNGQWVPAR